jgi:hypothetical protein
VVSGDMLWVARGLLFLSWLESTDMLTRLQSRSTVGPAHLKVYNFSSFDQYAPHVLFFFLVALFIVFPVVLMPSGLVSRLTGIVLCASLVSLFTLVIWSVYGQGRVAIISIIAYSGMILGCLQVFGSTNSF